MLLDQGTILAFCSSAVALSVTIDNVDGGHEVSSHARSEPV